MLDDETYYVITTQSIHQIKYLIKASVNLQLKEANELIKTNNLDNEFIELEQKWIGEEVTNLEKLTNEQINEIIPPSIEIEDNI